MRSFLSPIESDEIQFGYLMMKEHNFLTSASGAPLPDNQNSLTAGPRGPLLVQDYQLFEKHAHFNRERIPERVVHAKGSAAFGTLTITHDITRYTRAKVFRPGSKTSLLLRFSTVAGERGAGVAERDVRGFAIKFYTEEGNWDLVGNNTPVFFIRDPYKFPDFIHSQKRDPRTNMRNATAMWDFWSLSPESLHQLTILMSDRGLPASYRHMNGYGSHTFSFWNDAGERYWVKFHFKTQQGIRNWTQEEAARVIGHDRESHQRDLHEAIERKAFPRWTLFVQIMAEHEADGLAFNPFDLTKVWPHGQFPLVEVGVLELDRNPDDYFEEVEQASFSPANVVPGIGYSPDKVLQFRLFSYADAAAYRLGINHGRLPVNTPRCPVHNYYRDGSMCAGKNGSGAVNYEPNSILPPAPPPGSKEPPLRIHGDADRHDHRLGNDDYTQAGDLFRLQDSKQRERLFRNIATAMQGVPQEIVARQLLHFSRADPRYAAGVTEWLESMKA